MTPKQYLSQYQHCYMAVRLAQSKVEQAEHDAAGVRAILYSDMPKSHNVEHDLSDAMVRIEEAAAEYKAIVKANTNIMSEVAATILEVDDDREMRVLWLRYIDGIKDEYALASAMGYEPRWMWELHGRGLASVRRILEDREKNRAVIMQ